MLAERIGLRLYEFDEYIGDEYMGRELNDTNSFGI